MSKIRQTTAEWSTHFRARIKALIDALTDRVDAIEQAGYITQKTDPTVPSWAKEPTKPTYTASEVGANPDGMAVPAKDVTIGIEPVQAGSGDPSQTNVRPISGWTGANVTRTGKNLFDLSAMKNDHYINSNGSISSINTNFHYLDFAVLPAGNYIISVTGSEVADTLRIACYDNSKNFISLLVNTTVTQNTRVSVSFTVPANAIYIRVSFRKDYTNAQLELGSIATAYESYVGTTYPISWQSVAGTVYGGTLDVTTGLLTVTHGNIASYVGESLPGKWISSMDVYSAGGTPTTGAQVVYELATPQTYQLTPTEVELLLGNNNVWADTGDTTVTYCADTKLYIQKINAPTDDDMIADAQIASGKYFIVGGNLYRSTTTIPAGDAINPGTNCILTNLADALNALNT